MGLGGFDLRKESDGIFYKMFLNGQPLCYEGKEIPAVSDYTINPSICAARIHKKIYVFDFKDKSLHLFEVPEPQKPKVPFFFMYKNFCIDENLEITHHEK